MTDKQKEKRNAEIVDRRCLGESIVSIGRDFGLSGSRVAEICKKFVKNRNREIEREMMQFRWNRFNKALFRDSPPLKFAVYNLQKIHDIISWSSTEEIAEIEKKINGLKIHPEHDV